MQTKNLLFLSAASVLMLTSCSSKLGALSADNIKVVPNPMETEAGQVPVTINGIFPEKYMKKKAVVTVTPVLRYNGQSVAGSPATFQGEKVQGNDQTISYLVGGHYTMKSNFKYVPEMQKSELYLTFNAKVGKKAVNVPEIKVADGIIATSELYKETMKSSQACLMPDAFQRIVEQKQVANVNFLIQQAELRKSELKNNSVKEFVNLLNEINNDRERLNLTNIEVSAYASPDGGVKLNDKLANKRQQNSEKFVGQQLKKAKMQADVDANYTAQDWEGFQELVKASNIQDKDVILRVLSMYKDPEEREAQIKSMSSAFRELADGILPQLRRARMTINYELIGRSDAQIEEQLKADAKELSVEEMLYSATLTNDCAEKAARYTKTAEIYPNDARAFNNLATLAYANGDYNKAKDYLNKAVAVSNKAAEAKANLGMIALQSGDVKTAETLISQAAGANGLGEVLGNLHIAQGNYAQAAIDFGNSNSNSAALAQLLNKDYASALQTLSRVKNANGVTDYLKAIINARQGNNSAAAQALKSALAKDPSLQKYAANDLELKNVK
ncbi:MAG: tetratricopeptide repeat protein [Prevotella sp.]|nr:tetratricopeptide repeat protein [Prevotella sp.]MBO5205269.1 tetratricopeptide repeat protein [Prevotella sp.]MDO5525925.1 tetratricopeptide repeat protein [Prevotella sp.]